MDYIFEILPNLISGLKNTILIFVITLLASLPLGVLIALLRMSKIKPIEAVVNFYIVIMRGTPLLLQIITVYYGLTSIGIVLDRLPAVLIAFILNYTAYFAEIFRGGIQSIDRGQYEASIVTGISKWHNFRFIILPQVIKRTITSISNEIITLIKDTALVYVVGIGEVIHAAKVASNRDASLLPFLLAGIIFLVVSAIIQKGLRIIERRYEYYE
jgi:polar amino acid transport system permease protein